MSFEPELFCGTTTAKIPHTFLAKKSHTIDSTNYRPEWIRRITQNTLFILSNQCLLINGDESLVEIDGHDTSSCIRDQKALGVKKTPISFLAAAAARYGVNPEVFCDKDTYFNSNKFVGGESEKEMFRMSNNFARLSHLLGLLFNFQKSNRELILYELLFKMKGSRGKVREKLQRLRPFVRSTPTNDGRLALVSEFDDFLAQIPDDLFIPEDGDKAQFFVLLSDQCITPLMTAKETVPKETGKVTSNTKQPPKNEDERLIAEERERRKEREEIRKQWQKEVLQDIQAKEAAAKIEQINEERSLFIHDIKAEVCEFVGVFGKDSGCLALSCRSWYKALSSIALCWKKYQVQFGLPLERLLRFSTVEVNYRYRALLTLREFSGFQRRNMVLVPENGREAFQQSDGVRLVRTGHLYGDFTGWNSSLERLRYSKDYLKCLKVCPPTLPTGSKLLRDWPSLVHVDLRGVALSTTHIPDGFFENCPALQTIDFAGFSKVASIGKRFLCKCPLLEALDLRSMTKVESIGDDFLLGSTSHLQSFEYSSSSSDRPPPPIFTATLESRSDLKEMIQRLQEGNSSAAQERGRDSGKSADKDPGNQRQKRAREIAE